MWVSILVCVLYNIAFVVVIVCVYLLGTTLCRLLAFCVTHFEIDNYYISLLSVTFFKSLMSHSANTLS